MPKQRPSIRTRMRPVQPLRFSANCRRACLWSLDPRCASRPTAGKRAADAQYRPRFSAHGRSACLLLPCSSLTIEPVALLSHAGEHGSRLPCTPPRYSAHWYEFCWRPSRTRRGHPLVPARRGQGHADALFSLGAMHVAARGCPAGATPRPALLLRGSGARGGERHVRRVRPGRGLCQGAGAARDYAPSPPVVWMPITADDCLWVSEYVGLRSVGRVSQKAAGVAACIPTTRPLRGQAPVVYAARCSMYPPGSKS